MYATEKHSADRGRPDLYADTHQELSHSGSLKEHGMTTSDTGVISDDRSTANIEGQRVSGSTMQNAFKDNQARLHEQSGKEFGPQHDLHQRVAEQRSENEHKITESSGEIDKKESTVQTSSDILKGENLNATGNFKIHRKEAEIDQQMPVIDSAEKRRLEAQLLELRKKSA